MKKSLAGLSIGRYIYRLMTMIHTPFFPAFRARLAALGRRTAQTVRQTTLAQLQEHLRAFRPAHVLAAADDGPTSRARVFTLRLTFECFVWQMLPPPPAAKSSATSRRSCACTGARRWTRATRLMSRPANGCRGHVWRKP